MRLEAKQGAVYAGVDVFGLRDAFRADPAGTVGAVTLDGLLGAGVALAGAYVADELNGDSKDGGQSAKPASVPQVQADTFIYNQGNGTINFTGESSY